MSGLVASFAVVLLVAGVAKLRSPDGTAAALVAARLPGRRAAARALGAVECGVAVLALSVGGRWAAAVLAAAYLVLTAAALRLVRRDRGRDCGCFGAARSPVGPWHVAVDSVGAAIATAAAVTGAASLRESVAAHPVQAPALLALVGVLAALLVLTLTTLPELLRDAEATT